MEKSLKYISQGKTIITKHKEKRTVKEIMKEIFPNFPWEEVEKQKQQNALHLKLLHLKQHFKIENEEDWLKLSRSQFLRKGGKEVMETYKSDSRGIVKALFPDYQEWETIGMKEQFQTQQESSSSVHFLRYQLLMIQRLYCIQRLEDWYRIALFRKAPKCNDRLNYNNNNNNNNTTPDRHYDRYHYYHHLIENDSKSGMIISKHGYINQELLITTLKRLHADQQWSDHKFCSRVKRSHQRSLFLSLHSIFPHFLLLENYLYPSKINPQICEDRYNMLQKQTKFIEFDIFVAEINAAFEYQGEHHYHQISPSAFGSLELHQSRDELKSTLSHSSNLYLFHIPYWWNLCPRSLFRSTVGNVLFKL